MIKKRGTEIKNAVNITVTLVIGALKTHDGYFKSYAQMNHLHSTIISPTPNTFFTYHKLEVRFDIYKLTLTQNFNL